MHLLYCGAAALLLIVQVCVSQGFELTVHPGHPRVANVGDRLVFACNAFISGHGTPVLRWKFQGQAITSSSGRLAVHDLPNNSILRITDIRGTDAGTYTCEGSNSLTGEVKFKTVSLTVSEPLSINSDTEQYGEVGSTGTVMCEVSGFPQPEVSWRFGNRHINSGSKYTILEDRLIIQDVESSDEGTYTCEAFQLSRGEIETLNINYHVSGQGFELTVHPGYPRVANVGDRLVFACNAFISGHETPVLRWKFQGQAITSSSGRLAVHELPNNSILRITDIRGTDAGTYTCEGSNSLTGEVKFKTVSLTVSEPLSINSDTEQYGEVGSTGTVMCEVSGFPQPEVSWRFGNRHINSGSKYTILEDRLVIQDVESSDEGTYTCEAIQRSRGEIETLNINYHVSGQGFELTVHPGYPRVANVGDRLVFACNAFISGHETPVLRWKFQGQAITSSSGRLAVLDLPYNSILRITDIRGTDAGTYTCEGSDSLTGEVKFKTVSLTVSEPAA